MDSGEIGRTGAEGAMRKSFRQKDRIRTKLRKVRDDTEEAIPAGQGESFRYMNGARCVCSAPLIFVNRGSGICGASGGL